MSDDSHAFSAERGDLHHIQVRQAFVAGRDPDHPARIATLVAAEDASVLIEHLDGSHEAVTVHQPERLAAVLDRDDLCTLRGRPLLLVNTHYRVLAIATGPATPPARLEVLVVPLVEDGSVVELVSDAEDQPGWQTLALRRSGGDT